MNDTLDSSLSTLNDCDCCAGLAVQTPVKITNRSGLEAIAYRIGTHPQFKQSLLAHLSDARFSALNELNTRDDDDFTIALLDSWATVLDVLTFYSERYNQESYLRTAKERVSLLHLAQLIGYKPHPGVAASTYLAFTVEDAPSSPQQVPIDIGVKVQSIPKPEEKAQVFETIEKFTAHAKWNAIRPRLTRRHPVDSRLEYFFAGTTTGLQPGNGLLLEFDSGLIRFRQVAEVIPQPMEHHTLVRLQAPPSVNHTPDDNDFANPGDDNSSGGNLQGSLFRAVPLPSPSSFVSSFLQANTLISEPDLQAASRFQATSVRAAFANLEATKPPPPKVLAFRTEAAIFGHNAPRWRDLSVVQRIGQRYSDVETVDNAEDDGVIEANEVTGINDNFYELGLYRFRRSTWVENNLASYHDDTNNNNEFFNNNDIFLDNSYPKITEASWIVLKDGDDTSHYQVLNTIELTKSDFAITAKITRLTLDSNDSFEDFGIRTTKVFAQSEELELAPLPIEDPVSGNKIELDGIIQDLFAGQKLIFCGESNQERGNHFCELVTLAELNHNLNENFAELTLTAELVNEYVRSTLKIHANVVLATHGETVQEVLGSGDASQVFQQFLLRQATSQLTLTHVSAATPSGTESTLRVRVNNVLWQEVSNLFELKPDQQVFMTQTDNENKTTVQFADGKSGTRLPTGQENVSAIYRKGIGVAGNVTANQLSQLMSRPMGLRGVTNLMPATGGDDAESRDRIRQNASLTVLTFDRIVSLQDYEDFAQAFAGIAKALATWTWDGQKRGVFITIAGPNGAEIEENSPLYDNLLTAIRKAGDPTVSVRIGSYRKARFRVQATIQVNPDYLPEKVLAAVHDALQFNFSFEQRRFGQGVALSDVIAVMQAIAGVTAVDVDRLFRLDLPFLLQRIPVANLLRPLPNTRLLAQAPQPGARGTVEPAELLLLDEKSLSQVRVGS